jgi:phosphatidylinositol alpha-mannosyltransferase
MSAAYPILEPALEKIGARVAVSEDARRTLVEHVGGDAVLIPNGVFVDRFAQAAPILEWRGPDGTVGFLGRMDEVRKGLPTLLAAMTEVVAARPGVRLLVAGRGDVADALEHTPPEVRDAVTFLGMVSEPEKAALLRTVDVYVAPNLGGESFGVILVEAMSAGTTVLASDLDSFRRVLDDGRVGVLFPTGDTGALATELLGLLADPARRSVLTSAAREWVARYDWDTVADDLIAVYETVAAAAGRVGEDVPGPWRGRLRRMTDLPGGVGGRH